jgi:Ca2+-binding EF-hand superfamily protein
MVSLGFEAKSSTIFQMIADLDADGSGQLEFPEWVHLMTNRVSDKDSRDNMGKIFSLFDQQKQGAITIDDLRNVADSVGENIDLQEL